ncbi:MAG: hypothetical protein JSU03_03205 [Bacteroidetes bacterium]|nr:hypothetical protein [Bacteroidota bacterium]MBS1756264.1 hypothetical protein [Bacteroidota bacterium]
MKQLIALMLVCGIMTSCKKDDSNINTGGNNEAIYKGVLVGSGDASLGHATGAIRINLSPNGTFASVYCYFLDGIDDSLNVLISTIGKEKKFNTTIGTYAGGVSIQFSTGVEGNTPTLSGFATENGSPCTMNGVIMQETSVQPIGTFLTVGHSTTIVSEVIYSFIQYGNTIKGYERWGTTRSGNVESSVTMGQFTSGINLSAAGSLFKYSGIYNNSDSTVTRTYYNISTNEAVGNWKGWRIN